MEKKIMKGIDISKMIIACRPLLRIAEIALDESKKNDNQLDSIRVISDSSFNPELKLTRGEGTTTIKYFRGHGENYPYILEDGSEVTKEIARKIGRRVHKEYPELGLQSAINLYPELRFNSSQ